MAASAKTLKVIEALQTVNQFTFYELLDLTQALHKKKHKIVKTS